MCLSLSEEEISHIHPQMKNNAFIVQTDSYLSTDKLSIIISRFKEIRLTSSLKAGPEFHMKSHRWNIH